jgi:hypothetical protein
MGNHGSAWKLRWNGLGIVDATYCYAIQSNTGERCGDSIVLLSLIKVIDFDDVSIHYNTINYP